LPVTHRYYKKRGLEFGASFWHAVMPSNKWLDVVDHRYRERMYNATLQHYKQTKLGGEEEDALLTYTQLDRHVRQKQALQLLHATLFSGENAALLAAHGIRAWLDFGTLLAVHRTGTLIPWDKDSDIGMTRRDFGALQALHRAKRLRFNAEHVQLDILRSAQECVPGRFIDRRTGFFVDIFGGYETHADLGVHMLWPWASTLCDECPACADTATTPRCKHNAHTSAAELTCFKHFKPDLFPLQRCVLEGLAFSCPQHIRRWLHGKYSSVDYIDRD
jgi:hypothetical protein